MTHDPHNLHALVDGQLEASEAESLVKAVEADPKLRQELDAITQVKSVVREHCRPIHDEECWKACQARLAAVDRADRVNSFVGKYSWQLCASLVMLILVVGAWNRSVSPGNSLDPSRVPLAASFAPAQGGQADPYGFGSFLRNVWNLTGAYRGTIDGRVVARYDFEDGLGAFTLYVVPGVQKLEGACHQEVQGMNCYSWVADGTQFILVGQRAHPELQALADRVRALR